MSTVRELKQKIDSLVFEYLKSTCESPEVAQLFQQDRMLEIIDTGGITLEGLYFSHLRKSNNELVWKGNDYSAEVKERNDWDWEEPEEKSSTAPIPNLPPEMIGKLMNYFSIKERFSLRLINKNWNLLSSDNLRRHKRIPIKICHQQDVDRFVNSFTNRIQGSVNPFAIYHVHLNGCDVLPVFDAIGQDITTLNLEAHFGTSGTILSQIFKRTPRVQNLCIYGKVSIKDTDYADSELSNLSSLRLTPSTSTRSGEPFYVPPTRARQHQPLMDHKSLTKWLRLAPSLQQLHCNYVVHVDSAADFAQMIYSHGSVDTISLNCISMTSPASGPFESPDNTLKPEVPRLLNLTFLDDVTSEVEESVSALTHCLSTSLQKLTLTLKTGNVTVSSLPKLRNLTIKMNCSDFVPNPITANSVPALKYLTLSGCVATNLGHNPFHDDVFPTVESLDLVMTNQYRELINHGNVSWQSMFPKLTSLRVTGHPSAGTLNKINDNFANILHLSLILDYYPVSDWDDDQVDLPYFGVQEVTENGQTVWRWIFSNLKKLTTLELQFFGLYGSIVQDLAHLTLMKIMKPLEILSFNRGLYHTYNHVDGSLNRFNLSEEVKYKEELGVLFSLQGLNYHKNIKLAKLDRMKAFNYNFVQ